MDKIVLIYDIIYIFEDRYEFKGMRRKPILKILYDCFFSSMSWAFLFVPLYTLLYDFKHRIYIMSFYVRYIL